MPCRRPVVVDGRRRCTGADSTILMTGGTRGITAAVALELARSYQPDVAAGRTLGPAARRTSRPTPRA